MPVGKKSWRKSSCKIWGPKRPRNLFKIAISLKYFLRSNILKKISPKDLPMVCFVVTQHSESALSLCLRYSKTSCEATPKNIRLRSDDPMDHGPPRYSTMSLTSRAENHLLVFLYPCFARAAVRGWQRQIHDIRRLTAVCGVADGKYLSAKSFLV